MDYVEVARLHSVWRSMMSRCYKESNKQFKDYGGRGIFISKEWHDFNNFAQWCLDNGSARGKALDRVDNDGPYSSENCRFVTHQENSNNKRNNHWVEAFGERKTIAEWSRDARCVVSSRTLNQRIALGGWPPEDALTIKRARDRQSAFCPSGHPKTEDNVYRRKSGDRLCAVCSREAAKRYYQKAKEQAA